MKAKLFIFLSFFALTQFLAAGENDWITSPDKTFSFPEPEPGNNSFLFKTGACPKYYKEGISVSELENPMKEVSQTDFSKLTELNDDLENASLLKALYANLKYWQAKPAGFKIKLGPDYYDRSTLLKTTQRFIELFSGTLSNEEILSSLKKEFKIYKAVADPPVGEGKTAQYGVTITGYYESEIQVSDKKTGNYIYPLYLKPADLVKTPAGSDFDYGRYDENGKLVKYYSTAEIHQGRIDGLNLEISWSDHPSQIMLAQIQGSSILRYPDGNYIRIGFDGANGWPFNSVQRILMDCGEIPSMSFKDFIKYLSSQPQEREAALTELNQRYIFFGKRDKNSLPYGAMGTELTDERSVAIDPEYIPLGLTGFIKSKKPCADENGNFLGFKDFSRFVTAQDTGSAIRGPGRIDLFWGNGKRAETEASSMKADGQFYLFILK